MEPRLIKGLQADYEQVAYPGRNTSGLKPYGQNVLVKVDPCAAASGGGILLTDDMIEKMTMASETGCIYAIGPAAFAYFDDGTPWRGVKPQPGDRIYFQRYAGVVARGIDGAVYRVMDQNALAAGIDDETIDEAIAQTAA